MLIKPIADLESGSGELVRRYNMREPVVDSERRLDDDPNAIRDQDEKNYRAETRGNRPP